MIVPFLKNIPETKRIRVAIECGYYAELVSTGIGITRSLTYYCGYILLFISDAKCQVCKTFSFALVQQDLF